VQAYVFLRLAADIRSASKIVVAPWIFEKFRAWSDCGGNLESVFTRDRLLANISLYWFTGAIWSSFYPYYFRRSRPWMIPRRLCGAPTGYAEFPRETLGPPRSLAERSFVGVRRWTSMPKGIGAFFWPMRA
jgi:microsomal epoxide hydrolase